MTTAGLTSGDHRTSCSDAGSPGLAAKSHPPTELRLPRKRCRYSVGVYERAIQFLIAFIAAETFPSQALDGQFVEIVVALPFAPMRNVGLHHSAPHGDAEVE
jgi:hypothetical protein